MDETDSYIFTDHGIRADDTASFEIDDDIYAASGSPNDHESWGLNDLLAHTGSRFEEESGWNNEVINLPQSASSKPYLSRRNRHWDIVRQTFLTPGLKLIYEPQGQLVQDCIPCDVVLIHGLGSNAISTWQSRSSNCFWPESLLPNSLPGARVMTFSYDQGSSTSSPQTFRSVANKLLLDLSSFRRDCQDRPLVWLAHSLGGFIVKAALSEARISGFGEPNLKSIEENTAGIIFFGTPHRALSSLGWMYALSKIAVFDHVEIDVLDTLKPNSTIEHLSQSFDQNLDTLRVLIYSFYETNPTTAGGMPMPITSEANALYHPSERVGFLNGDHNSMCQFENESQPGYRQVISAIKDILLNYNGPGQQHRSTSSLLRMVGIEDSPSTETKSYAMTTSETHFSKSIITEPDESRDEYQWKADRIRELFPVHKNKWTGDLPFHNSCDWIAKTEEAKAWLHGTESSDRSNLLLLSGAPGTGKSVGVRYLIEHLRKDLRNQSLSLFPRPHVLHYFHNFHTESPAAARHVFSELIAQMLDTNLSLVRHFPDDFFEKLESKKRKKDDWPAKNLLPPMDNNEAHENGDLLDDGNLSIILLSMLRDAEVSQVFLLLDGLDDLEISTSQLTLLLCEDFLTMDGKRLCFTCGIGKQAETMRLWAENRQAKVISFDRRPMDKASKRRVNTITAERSWRRSAIMSQVQTGIDDRLLYPTQWSSSYLYRNILHNTCTKFTTEQEATLFFNQLAARLSTSPDDTVEEPQAIWVLCQLLVERLSERTDPLPMITFCFIALARRPLTLDELNDFIAVVTFRLEHATTSLLDLSVETGVRATTFSSLSLPLTTARDKKLEVEQLEPRHIVDLSRWLAAELPGLVDTRQSVVTIVHQYVKDTVIRTLVDKGSREDVEGEISIVCLELTKLLQAGQHLRGSDKQTYALSEWSMHVQHAPAHSGKVNSLLQEIMDKQRDVASLWLKGARRKCPPESLDIACVLSAFNLHHNLQNLAKDVVLPDCGNVLSLPLRIAASNDALEALRFLSDERGHDIHLLDQQKRSLMFYAIWAGSTRVQGYLSTNLTSNQEAAPAVIQALATKGNLTGIPNTLLARADFQSKVMRSAAFEGNFGLIDVFIKRFKLNFTTLQSTLEDAVRGQHKSVVEKLLTIFEQQKILGEKMVKLGESLRLAAKRANIELVELLLEHRADSNDQSPRKVSALHYGAQSGKIQLVNILVRAGAYRSRPDGKGRTPLHWAAERGHTSVVEYLITTSDKGDNNGQTALHLACACGSFPTVRKLLDYGSSVNKRDFQKRTSLHVAARTGAVDLVKMLLDEGADPELLTASKRTPLHEAASGGWAEVAEAILAVGPSELVDKVDVFQKTALHYACANKRSATLIGLLLDHHANILAEDKLKRLPIHYGAAEGTAEMVKLLLPYGRDSTDFFNMTPLNYAAKNAKPEIIKVLLDSALSELPDNVSSKVAHERVVSMLTASNNNAKMSFHYAAEHRDPETFQELANYFWLNRGMHAAEEELSVWREQWLRILNIPDARDNTVRRRAEMNPKLLDFLHHVEPRVYGAERHHSTKPVASYLSKKITWRFPVNFAVSKTRKNHYILPPGIQFPLKKLASLPSSQRRSVLCAYQSTEECRWNDTIAIKTIPLQQSRLAVASYSAQFEILESLHHNHISAILATYEQGLVFGMVIFPVAAWNLETYLQHISKFNSRQTIRRGEVPAIHPFVRHLRGFFSCLLNAMRYIHENAKRHNDIKPSKILIDVHHNVLFADLSVYHHDTRLDGEWVNSDDVFESTDIPQRFKPPEVSEMSEDRRHGFAGDVFALGCIFFEMLSVIMHQRMDYAQTSRRNSIRDSKKVHQHTIFLYRNHVDDLKLCLDQLKEQRDELIYSGAKDLECFTDSVFDAVKMMISEDVHVRDRLDLAELEDLFHGVGVNICTLCKTSSKSKSGDHLFPSSFEQTVHRSYTSETTLSLQLTPESDNSESADVQEMSHVRMPIRAHDNHNIDVSESKVTESLASTHGLAEVVASNGSDMGENGRGKFLEALTTSSHPSQSSNGVGEQISGPPPQYKNREEFVDYKGGFKEHAGDAAFKHTSPDPGKQTRPDAPASGTSVHAETAVSSDQLPLPEAVDRPSGTDFGTHQLDKGRSRSSDSRSSPSRLKLVKRLSRILKK
ncbi:uncharacterized protein PV09_03491 [Verruconis gallopava]|uniref:Protein kinase domain-containing protein n=1 Tax=Verruconis gallopava TaxID=253628 RepID=A0A0D2AGD8_9PEZI|nr:uncharacterized protein PV09_03491 [Verruconis gallopava]KIW05620.1 hypothetical protein PV09_03491 [Verruconis gallopava]